MIGFNELGRLGNLGNQMFQFAALKGIASHHGYEWKIPPNDDSRIHDYSLFRIFEMSSVKSSNVGYVPHKDYSFDSTGQLNPLNFGFDFDFFNQCPDNVNIKGFFQSEKYFENFRNEIKVDFTFKSSLIEFVSARFPQLSDKFIALHVRRGDYLNLTDHYRILDEEYYNQALDRLPDWPLMIFTDDKKWIKESNFLGEREFIISEFEDYAHDLCLMSMASALIIANSTFSWWGAWLSGSSKIIAPRQWFEHKLSHLNTTHLIPKTWEVI